MIGPAGDRVAAVLLGISMFAIFNANGREIATYDSQPTKFAARELLLRGTLALNHVVGRAPALAERSAFVVARDGRYRSAYSPLPAVLAAGVTWPLWKAGAVDIRAPGAPSLMAAVTASFLVALAVSLVFLACRRTLSTPRALAVAVGLGLGTGLWPTASQTLWQHETAIAGLALAVYAWMSLRAGAFGTYTGAALVGVGLGLAGASRIQLAPAVVVLVIGLAVSLGWRAALVAATLTAAIVVPVLAANHRWFGTVLGAAPLLEALHGTVHRTSGSFSFNPQGLAGLLISPSRGLFIFSPVVLVAVAGLRGVFREGWRAPHAWSVLAALAQFVLYGSYAVWWGGHTYGPRYMLDILPLLVPAAIMAMTTLRGRLAGSVASLALAWSVATAALGAFCYPHERWNSDPADVDRYHERLWEWSDTQIARAWHTGPSPQNFTLFTRHSVRVPQP